MGELQIFKHDLFQQVRVIEIDGEPWFVAKDIAENLAYKNQRDAINKHVDECDKKLHPLFDGHQIRHIVILNESGVYCLTFSSKLPIAKAFRRWISAEVIPSIRKHGTYFTTETLNSFLSNPDNMIRVLTEYKKEKELRVQKEQEIAQLMPKVNFADAISASSDCILIRQLATILTQNGFKIGEKALFQLLRERGYLIKQKGKSFNSPTQWSMDHKLFRIKETSITSPTGSYISATPYVTGIGQQYFVEKFQQGKLQVPNKKIV